MDYKLICTICNKLVHDPQSFTCGHIFCQECISKKKEEENHSVDNFPEINHTVHKKIDGLNENSNMIRHENKQQQNQLSTTLFFEPLKCIFGELIMQNKQLIEQINQIKKQNNNLQLEINQLRQQTQLQWIEQTRKNQEFEFDINQLKEQIQFESTEQSRGNENNIKHTTHKNSPETNDQNTNVTSLRSIVKYPPLRKWKQIAVTVAGGNDDENQLYYPQGIFIDDDQTIYIADQWNDRIVEWKSNATNNQIIIGENQLDHPNDVIIDKENNTLIISDTNNRRVIQWSRQKNTTNGQIIISDIDCWGLTMDNNGSLYVSDYKKNEVKQWIRGDKDGRIIAGGYGTGDHFNQLNQPTFIFVDEDYSLYVSDSENHRVMKWLKDGKEGIIVAGGNGKGNSLKQLSSPRGIILDQFGQIYVADSNNHRIMRWSKEAQEGTIIVGGGEGYRKQLNRLYYPTDLSFDKEGHLYVVDSMNHRIQKFHIDFD